MAKSDDIQISFYELLAVIELKKPEFEVDLKDNSFGLHAATPLGHPGEYR